MKYRKPRDRDQHCRILLLQALETRTTPVSLKELLEEQGNGLVQSYTMITNWDWLVAKGYFRTTKDTKEKYTKKAKITAKGHACLMRKGVFVEDHNMELLMLFYTVVCYGRAVIDDKHE